jgi:long-subunit fatty acid transport protein
MRFTSNGYRNRFRYRFGASYPFGKEKKFQVGANNELFFTDKEPYFERNRSSVFLGYKATKNVSFQIGFLRQFDYKINDETGRSFLQVGTYFEL